MHKLAYSSCNEDAISEIKALNIHQEDSVLCITGSGARVLDLLTQAPKKIIAVDCNPSQQHLLKLKAAAIKNLAYDEFIKFIGLKPCHQRLLVFDLLKQSLAEDTVKFWEERLTDITHGVLFSGVWEKYFKRNAELTYLIRGKKQKNLFAATNLSQQKAIWDQQWATSFWQLLLKLCSNRFVWRYLLKDPGFYLYVPKSFDIYGYINTCFNKASHNFLFHESHFAHLLFWGHWHDQYLPLHLQEKYYLILKNNIDAIHYRDMDLQSAILALPEKSIDKFSLSDFSSYTALTDYLKIWQLIPVVAKKKAVICERQFLVKREVKETSYLTRNQRLEVELEKYDQSIFYSFIVASIESHPAYLTNKGNGLH